MIIVCAIEVLALLNHEDLNIIQYTIFEQQTDDFEVEFGLNGGSFAFGLYNFETDSAQDIDPRYGIFEIRHVITTISEIDGSKNIESISMSVDEVNVEDFP